MKNRTEKIRRKIKVLETEKQKIDKENQFNLVAFLKNRILKDKTLRDINKRAEIDRKKLSSLLKMEIEDLYEELNELEKTHKREDLKF